MGASTYVYADTTYDVLGRLDYMRFGNDYRTDYVYYPLTQQGGRVQQIKTGTSGNPTATQYLAYQYSGVGNVTQIVDHKNGPQTMTFGYDNLNRLTSASASGGARYRPGGVPGAGSAGYQTCSTISRWSSASGV